MERRSVLGKSTNVYPPKAKVARSNRAGSASFPIRGEPWGWAAGCGLGYEQAGLINAEAMPRMSS
jgi:hypothetical protein